MLQRFGGRAARPYPPVREPCPSRQTSGQDSARGATRTRDRQLRRLQLYPLSYAGDPVAPCCLLSQQFRTRCRYPVSAGTNVPRPPRTAQDR